MKLPAFLLALALTLLGSPPPAHAQVEAPPDPDPSYGDAEPERFKGFYTGFSGGLANPRGRFYRNDWDEGFGMLLSLGYRPIPFASVEGSFFASQHNVRGPDVGTAIITELALGARLFPLGAAPLQPTVAFSYAPIAGAESDELTLSGYTTTVALGLRGTVARVSYLQLDVRHSYLRYRKAKIDTGTLLFEGDLPREEHGDVISVLVGGGVTF